MESTFRLATATNNPWVARLTLDVAPTRNWRSLRVSGNEHFKCKMWLEAAAGGVKTLDYEPSPANLDLLKKEREPKQVTNQTSRSSGCCPHALGNVLCRDM